jgi:hypothetical protein
MVVTKSKKSRFLKRKKCRTKKAAKMSGGANNFSHKVNFLGTNSSLTKPNPLTNLRLKNSVNPVILEKLPSSNGPLKLGKIR